jgi:hypothetical protein
VCCCMNLDTGAVLEALRRWQIGLQTAVTPALDRNNKMLASPSQEAPGDAASGRWAFRTYTDVLHAESVPSPEAGDPLAASRSTHQASQRARKKGGEGATASHGPSQPPDDSAELPFPASGAARRVPEVVDPGFSDEDFDAAV